MKDKEFQSKLVKELRKCDCYHGESVYTVLFELCDSTSLEEVFTMLHNVAHDMGKVEELKEIFEKSKGFKWAEKA